MSLIYTPDLFEKLRDANLLLDTCTLIDASNCAEVDDFLESLLKRDCTFLSLPSVKEEFTCSACNLDEYKQLSDYIESLQIILLNNTEKQLSSNKNMIFNIALKRCRNIHPSHVDRMLLATPYLFSGSAEKIFLMTSNYKDVPQELFSLVGFVSYESAGVFHNIGVYGFDNDGFHRKVSDLL